MTRPLMHGFEANIDWTFLDRKVLEQVAFGRFDTQLHFEDDVTVAIYCDDFEVLPPSAVRSDPGSFTSRRLALVGLLGTRVERVLRPDPKTLVIQLSDCANLTLHDRSADAESFIISSPSAPLVV
jgi:hypothetical protein